MPDKRFAHIHIDIIGPLPNSDGFKHCLTMIDRFTRWPEAIPIKNIKFSTIANTLVSSCIARGCPEVFTSDRGIRFTSELFPLPRETRRQHHDAPRHTLTE